MTTKQTTARTLVPLGSARAKTQAPGPGTKIEPNIVLHYE